MRKSTFFVLAAAMLVWSGAASAQGFVIGKGFHADCYQAATQQRNSRDDLEMCDRALVLSSSLSRSDRTATHVNRAIVRMHRGDLDGALRDLDTAENLMPNKAEIYTNRGVALTRLERYNEAIAQFDLALEKGERLAYIAHYGRAVARERAGDITGAYHDYKAALDLSPGWAPAAMEIERFEVSESS